MEVDCSLLVPVSCFKEQSQFSTNYAHDGTRYVSNEYGLYLANPLKGCDMAA